MADPFTQEQLFHMAFTEHTAPGQRCVVLFEVPREVTDAETAAIERHLRQGGLSDAMVQFGSTSAWPDAIQMQFTRPASDRLGPRQWQIIMLLLAGLGVAGLGLGGGFQVGGAIGKNLIPLAMIGAGAAVLIALVMSRGNARYELSGFRR